MLSYFVGDLFQDPPGTLRSVAIDEPDPTLGPELDFAGPLRGSARLHRIQHGLLVQCNLATLIHFDCSRCLQPTTQEIHAHFDEEFRFWGESIDPEGFLITEHHILNLSEAARQYLVLELPLKPLCRADCPGLCPACGEPLRDHECSASLSASSGPLGALAELLHREDLRQGEP